MSKICVVTESAADIPIELRQKHEISVVPMNIIYPDTDEVLKEGINITNEEYYDLLEKAEKHPYTAQGNNADMLALFKKLDTKYEEIFYVTMSSQITSTLNSANIVRKAFKREGGKASITLFDSKQASLGIGIQAIKASVLFKKGYAVSEVVEKLEHFRNQELKSTLTVESLKYLMRGGRINKMKYIVGSILNIHPCLEGSSSGTLDVFSSTRSYEQAIEQVVEYAFDNIPTKNDLACYIVEGRSNKGLKVIKNYLKTQHSSIKILGTQQLSPVIFTHTGPGVIAFILFKYFEH